MPSEIRKTRLYKTVGASLVKMKDRCLDFTPASENLPNVAEVMTEDLIMLGYTDNDCVRIANAIDASGRTFSRFPTIFHVKQLIKSNEQITFETGQHKRLGHTVSKEDREKNAARIKKLVETLNTKEDEPEKPKQAPMVSDPEKRERIKRELEAAAKKNKLTPLKTPEEIEAENITEVKNV